MTKDELIAAVAEATDLDKTSADAAIKAVFSALSTSLAQGDDTSLSGFGAFSVGERAAREGRNPQTGEAIQIAASKVVKFKPAKALKDAVNGQAKLTAELY